MFCLSMWPYAIPKKYTIPQPHHLVNTLYHTLYINAWHIYLTSYPVPYHITCTTPLNIPWIDSGLTAAYFWQLFSHPNAVTYPEAYTMPHTLYHSSYSHYTPCPIEYPQTIPYSICTHTLQYTHFSHDACNRTAWRMTSIRHFQP